MNSHVDWFQLGSDSQNRYIQKSLPKTDSPLQAPRVALEIIRGKANQLFRMVETPVFLIGSATDCDLVLGDPHFPDVHTYLFLNNSGVTVRRIAPDPVMKINDSDCESGKLLGGDLLQLGVYSFRIHISPSHDPTKQSRIDERHPIVRSPDHDEAKSSVEPLLEDIRDHLYERPTTLRLYRDEASPWQSVTTNTGLRIRPAG